MFLCALFVRRLRFRLVNKTFANNGTVFLPMIFFVAYAGMLILSTLYPTSEWVVEDEASAGTRPVNAWTP